MVPLLVFYVHIVGSAAAFTRRWQEEGVGEGLLAVFFVALIFFVGWGMASFVMRIFMPPEGFGTLFDRDAASLALLTILESVFYYFYLRSDDAEPAEQE
jgi:hypothetical protein